MQGWPCIMSPHSGKNPAKWKYVLPYRIFGMPKPFSTFPPLFLIFLPITHLSFSQNNYLTVRIYLIIKIILGKIAGRNSQSPLPKFTGKRFASGKGNISPVWRRNQIVWNKRFEQRLTGSPVWANFILDKPPALPGDN